MVANASKMKNSGLKGKVQKTALIQKRKEFLFNIGSSTQFQTSVLEVNPGLEQSFPWTSQVAPSFQKYRFQNVKFMYKTSVSTFSPGMVMFAIQTDVARPQPETKEELLELSGATRSPIWKDFELPISKSDEKVYKEYFIRSAKVDERKLYDPFYLVVGVDNVDLDFPIGELWIEYEVYLIDPAPLNPDIILGKLLYQNWTGPSTGTSGNIITPTTMFGGNLEGRFGDLDVVFTSPNTMTFNEQFTGLMIYYVIPSGLANQIYDPSANLNFSVNSSNNALVIPNLAIGGNPTTGNTNNAVVRTIQLFNFVRGDSITFNNGGWFQQGSNASYIEIQMVKVANSTTIQPELLTRNSRMKKRETALLFPRIRQSLDCKHKNVTILDKSEIW